MLKISSAPHITSPIDTKSLMRDVVIALMPALVAAVIFFGLGALKVIITSVAACVLCEYSINKYLLHRPNTITDYSAIITGLLLAFNLPSNFPIWMILIGAFVAIGITKMAFGGLGQNLFNPALVGRVFLFISFPQQMTIWPVPQPGVFNNLDAETGATTLGIIKHLDAVTSSSYLIEGSSAMNKYATSVANVPSYFDMFIGNIGGCLGEISALALLIGFAYLLYRRVISWHIPFYYISTVFLIMSIMWLVQKEACYDPLAHLLSGGLLLGAIFMATDYVTSPVTPKGKVVFAVGCGILTVIIRIYGAYPEGVSFAILIMNAFVPMIDRYTAPRIFGSGRK